MGRDLTKGHRALWVALLESCSQKALEPVVVSSEMCKLVPQEFANVID